MSVNKGIAFIAAAVHILTDNPHHPDDSQHMIDMLVGYNDMMNAAYVNSSLLQAD